MERLEIVQAETREVRQHAREAEDAIEELRRTDAERRGRGRWARLKAVNTDRTFHRSAD
jgi:hypothetical protein